MSEISKVCVYAASSTRVADEYSQAARVLGKIFAQNNIVTVYGGGSVGLMGALADSVIENKGEIIGVIPDFMMKLEWGNPRVDLRVVTDMAERKCKLIEGVDAVVALPGGTGTLEELAEIISVKKLGLFTKPIIIINTNNFYEHLIAFIERMIHDGFIRNDHRDVFVVIDNPEKVIDAIKNSPEINHLDRIEL